MNSALASYIFSKANIMEKVASDHDGEEASLTRNSSSSSARSSRSSTGSSFGKCRNVCDRAKQQSTKGHRCSTECIEKYPIHHAARMGKFEDLERLLNDPNCPRCPLEPDECLGRTPLHYACATGWFPCSLKVESGYECIQATDTT
jgi:hypothetical protein